VVNRKDADGMNIFQVAFWLDNIASSIAAPATDRWHIAQSDGTSWMAMYALNLLAIAMELAQEDKSYEDVASNSGALPAHCSRHEHRGDEDVRLWDEQDGFFYDVLHLPEGQPLPMKVRSMVGLIRSSQSRLWSPSYWQSCPTSDGVWNGSSIIVRLTQNVACMRTPEMPNGGCSQ